LQASHDGVFKCRNGVILRARAESLNAFFLFAVVVVVPSPLVGEENLLRKFGEGSPFLVMPLPFSILLLPFCRSSGRHYESELVRRCPPAAIQKLICLCLLPFQLYLYIGINKQDNAYDKIVNYQLTI
jgi:hypothetical protein